MDPYFKMRGDGTPGIRVDDPNDVIFGIELPNQNLQQNLKKKRLSSTEWVTTKRLYLASKTN